MEVPGEMTNQLSHRFGAGLAARLRSPESGGRVWTLFVALGLLVSAVPTLAAEIVEVRVGKHPTFTRVVFELDRPAGYRIERSDPSVDAAELIVSLEASSIPRSVTKKKSLIEQVDVEPRGRRSVARVRLAEEGLSLKEMILANPPRIVLDLINDAPAPSVAEAKPTPVPTATDEEQSFGDIVAQIEPEPSVVEEAPASVEETVMFEEPAPAPVVPPTPGPAPIEVASEDTGEALFQDDPQVGEADLADEPSTVGSEPSTSFPAEPEDIAVAMPPTQPAPTPAEPRTSRSATTEPAGDGGNMMVYALAGGALFLGIGAYVLVRRRGSSGDDGELDDDDEVVGGFDGETAAASDANPFAAADEETVVAGSGGETVVPGMTTGDDTTVVSVPDEEKESESVVFDAEGNDMDDMEVISRDQVSESLGSPAMAPVAGGASEDLQQMFAEMSGRMEALEFRCDELVDARDRLERQVAAQTEELRVQRAAIARTQRAVRNLGRGDDASDAQEATEPALREPTPE